MDIDQAIELLKKVVKNNSTNDSNHIDLGLVATEDRPQYEKALIVVKVAIMEGKLTQDDFSLRIGIA